MHGIRGKSLFIASMLVASLITNVFLFGPFVTIIRANPDDIEDSYYNETTLNVTVLQLEPRINWYDFQLNQGGSWVSRLNAQIDVNAEYRFIINISSDQGWADIDYINITVWHDNGSESTTYNNTGNLGGNLNLFLQYENTTGTANYNMLWPRNEVTKGTMTETIVNDPNGSPGNTECRNLTFTFTPGYQFRYAPGDGSWDTGEGHNDTWSWNFNITVEDASGYYSFVINEFGVYSYTEVASAGWPTIAGNPGTTAIADNNITIVTRSNGNYSLSVDVDTLVHTTNPAWTMSNTTISLRGGNLTTVTPFPGTGPLYLWGTDAPTYEPAEDNNTSKVTDDVEYRCSIPVGQQPGDYNATIRYHLRTQTN